MNKEMMKKIVANKVVDIAIQTAKMPNQACILTFGKPKTKYDLTSDDYAMLESVINGK